MRSRLREDRNYLPIEDHGVIGNLKTVALVGKNGCIDWFCFPHFDSPSVFGLLLDRRKGGHFSIAPMGEHKIKQVYWPDTNVLVTRFLCPDGVGEILDFMPVDAPRSGGGFYGLIRWVKVLRGQMAFRMECRPAFDYARATHRTEIVRSGAAFHSKDLSLGLSTDAILKRNGPGVLAEFMLREGEQQCFELHDIGTKDNDEPGIGKEIVEGLFHQTIEYWRRWLAKSKYRGRWRETVNRSALVLKLLTFSPTGAMVAAATCSLPETIGGQRNWDYRYTWIRDAAFTIYSLLRLGFTEEASAFMSWLNARCREIERHRSLQVMYGIDGRHALPEETLDHLEGYGGSRPVRVGNAAARQFQLDIYGELMDSVYLFNKHASPVTYELWTNLRALTDWVCKNWHRKDEGIWEVRSGAQHFVYSKMMCWVALDRALRLAAKRSFPADVEKWTKARDQLYEEIHRKGWSDQRHSFVQYFGGKSLDASALMMPLVFFQSPLDPRMRQTIAAINRAPREGGLVSDGLVYRYNPEESPDGIAGIEGSFNACTFWLVEALTRAGEHDPERLAEARLLFEQMLSYSNHLGLFAEQTGPVGESLGNFPQAFTHLSLISAAVNLDRRLARTKRER